MWHPFLQDMKYPETELRIHCRSISLLSPNTCMETALLHAAIYALIPVSFGFTADATGRISVGISSLDCIQTIRPPLSSRKGTKQRIIYIKACPMGIPGEFFAVVLGMSWFCENIDSVVKIKKQRCHLCTVERLAILALPRRPYPLLSLRAAAFYNNLQVVDSALYWPLSVTTHMVLP